MITVAQCDAYFADCQKLGTDPAISLERARAIIGICHAWIQLTQRVRHYELVVKRETDAEMMAQTQPQGSVRKHRPTLVPGKPSTPGRGRLDPS
jgi:hypothetical protein